MAKFISFRAINFFFKPYNLWKTDIFRKPQYWGMENV